MKKVLPLALLFATSLGLGSVRLAAQTLEDPVAVPVHVNANFWFDDHYTGDAGPGVDDFDLELTGVDSYPGASNGQLSMLYTESPQTGGNECARLEPDKTYSFSIEADNLDIAQVSIVAPPGYTVVIDGLVDPIVNPNPGTIFHTLRILSNRQTAVARSGTASSFTADHAYWQVSLGALQSGNSAGWISISDVGYGTDLSSLFTPAALQYFCYSSEATPYADPTTHYLRQVLANDVCVDVVTNSSTSYTLNFYPIGSISGSGFPYTFTTGPYVSYTIAEGSDADHVSITSVTYNGSTSERTAVTTLARTGSSWPYTWSAQDWSTSGTTAPVQVAVTSAYATTSGGPTTDTETIDVNNASSATATTTTKQFTEYDWGLELSAKNLGTTNPDLTAYQFYTTGGSSFGSYGFIQSVSHNGHWIGYEYEGSDGTNASDGVVSVVHEQYLNSTITVPSTLSGDTNGKVSTYSYTTDVYGADTLRTTIQTQYNGTTVGYSTIGYTGQVLTVDLNGLAEVTADRTDWANSSGTSTLSSETRYYRQDVADNDNAYEFYRNRLCSATRADGTKDSYAYQRGTWGGSGSSFTTSGLGSGTCSRMVVIHGTAQSTTPVLAGGTTSNTQITSIDGYTLEPVYVVSNESTRDITIRDANAHVVYTGTDVWTGSAWQNVQSVAYAYNAANELTQQTSSNGAVINNAYNGEQLYTQEDAAGITTTYSYDDAGRVSGTSVAAATLGTLATATNYDAASHVTSQVVGSSITTSASYDDAGRVSSTSDPNAGTTDYSYSPSTWTTTVTLPNGGVKTDVTYADGNPVSESGTGVVGRYYAYTVNSDGSLTTQVNYGTSTSSRYESVQTDMLGRTLETVKPTFNSTTVLYTVQNTYDSTYGWLNETTRSDGTNSLAPTLYLHDSMAECYRQCLDIAGSGALTLNGTDRITDTVQDIEADGSGNWWAKNKTITYPGSSSGTPLTTSIVQQRLTGFASGQLADQTSTDSYGTVTETSTTVNGSANTLTQTTTNPGLSSSGTVVSIAGLTTSQTDFAGLTTTIGYDSLWRPITQKDSRSNTITTSYNSGTTQVSQTEDATGTVLSSYTYDTAGRVVAQANANGKVTRIAYDTLNHVLNQWGDIPYPVAYGYDPTYGYRTSMSTYQAGTGWTGSSWPLGNSPTGTTAWAYDAETGLLTSKTDSASHVVNFTYNTFGQTATRAWARIISGTTHLTSSYTYDSHTGELTGVSYNDGGATTPLVYTYTRSGQLSTVSDAAGSRTFAYDSSINANPLEMEAEQLDSTFYGGRWLSRLYNTSTGTSGSTGTIKGRPAGFQLGSSENTSSDLKQSYTYTNGAQFASVQTQNASSASRTLNYSYLTSSNLINGYSTGSNFAVSRSYESQRDLLSSIQSSWGTGSGSVQTEFDYVHNTIYQTSSVVQSGAAFASYTGTPTSDSTFRKMTYDDRGELTSDIGYLGGTVTDTSNALPDRNFAYAYDNIGDRTSSNYTGNSANLETYSANNLNQYTARDNFTVPVSGTIAYAAHIGVSLNTVSSSPALASLMDGFWAEAITPPNNASGSVANSSGPAVFGLMVSGGNSSTDLVSKPQTVSLTIPPKSQSFTYDADGNLTADNMWTYTYDAENRLVQMVTSTAAAAAGVPGVTIAFGYDYLGRRVEKSVTNGSGTTVHRFIYDGWNLIADYKDVAGTLSIYRSFTWGLDVTGDLTAAGGVGALLELTNFSSGSTTDYFPTFDGNGNVASLLNGSSGALAAVYEYSSFGEALRPQLTATDSTVADNPFRFSTKFTDVETGLIYYGNRYYSPHMGRFINRDPMEEGGGINLYGFVNNDPANAWDVLGDDSQDVAAWQLHASEEGEPDNDTDSINQMATGAAMQDALSYAGQTGNANGQLVSSSFDDIDDQVNAFSTANTLASIFGLTRTGDSDPSSVASAEGISVQGGGSWGANFASAFVNTSGSEAAKLEAGLDSMITDATNSLESTAAGIFGSIDLTPPPDDTPVSGVIRMAPFYVNESKLPDDPVSMGPNYAAIKEVPNSGSGYLSGSASIGGTALVPGGKFSYGIGGSLGGSLILTSDSLYLKLTASIIPLVGIGETTNGGVGVSAGRSLEAPQIGFSYDQSNHIEVGAGVGDTVVISSDFDSSGESFSPPLSLSGIRDSAGQGVYGAGGRSNNFNFTIPIPVNYPSSPGIPGPTTMPLWFF